MRLACERHLRDLETGHERGLWFDELTGAAGGPLVIQMTWGDSDDGQS